MSIRQQHQIKIVFLKPDIGELYLIPMLLREIYNTNILLKWRDF